MLPVSEVSVCRFSTIQGTAGRDSLNGDFFYAGVSSNQDYTVLKMAFLEADSSFFLLLKGPIFLDQFTFNDAVSRP